MNHKGFTLIELIATVAMAAIVLAVGIPTFQETFRQSRLTTYTNEFVGALSLARSEAIKRGQRVTVCEKKCVANCDKDENLQTLSCSASGNYGQGWIVFVESVTQNGQVDNGEPIIRVFAAPPSGMTIVGKPNVGSYISYTSAGMSSLLSGAFQAGTFVMCKEKWGRELTLNQTGRLKVLKIDPIKPDPNVKPTSTCP